MAQKPPSMGTYGRIDHIIQKIKEAKTPDRFTYDYLKEVIQAKGSNDRAFVSLAKRCGLLNQDGSPTDRYRRLRSTTDKVSKAAMAEAMKTGYADLYSLNEYAHKLSEKDLEGLVLQLTGDEKGSKTVSNIVKTFFALTKHADFEAEPAEEKEEEEGREEEDEHGRGGAGGDSRNPVKFGLSYQINLVLPKTDDIAVFNAIFKSLKDHLLKE